MRFTRFLLFQAAGGVKSILSHSFLPPKNPSSPAHPPPAMADAYWRYEGRIPAGYQAPPSVPVKRPRTDFADIAGGPEFSGYVPRDEERVVRYVIRDNDSIGASYDHYLQNRQISSYSAGDSARPNSGVLTTRPVDDPRMTGINSVDSRSAGYGSRRSEASLPPDASNTLFMEGLPSNCTRREVSHIFRPFFGFREVRLVNKDSRHPGGDPLLLCFVDFSTPSQAAVALEALQDSSELDSSGAGAWEDEGRTLLSALARSKAYSIFATTEAPKGLAFTAKSG